MFAGRIFNQTIWKKSRDRIHRKLNKQINHITKFLDKNIFGFGNLANLKVLIDCKNFGNKIPKFQKLTLPSTINLLFFWVCQKVKLKLAKSNKVPQANEVFNCKNDF